LLAVIYFFTRLIYLDADFPVWNFSYYCEIDELHYTLTAFNWVEGGYSPTGVPLAPEGSYFSLIHQLVTALTLFIFGDNYYGLRVPSIIAGFAIYTSFYVILLKRFGLLASATFSLLLISNISFVMATRIAEPTIFRMAAASLLILYYFYFSLKSPLNGLIAGILTGVAWCFFYPTNAFLALFSFLIVGFFTDGDKLKTLFFYAVGLSVSILIFFFISSLLGADWESIYSMSKLISARVSVSPSEGMIDHFKSIGDATYFRVDPLLFYVSIGASIFVILATALRKNLFHKVDLIILIFLICFILQTLFINDYPQRKLVFILPGIFYLIILTINILQQFFSQIRLAYFLVCALGVFYCLVEISRFSLTSFQQIYASPRYDYKLAMKNLSDLNGERVIGGWTYGFRLYNSYKPYLNIYSPLYYFHPDKYYELIGLAGLHGDAKYSIAYGNEKTFDAMKKIGFEPQRVVLKSYDPEYPDVYLFQFKP
jgi:hypothetical protein